MSEAVIWSFFKKKGLSDCGAAGLMGNLYAESGLKPDNLQNTCEKKLGLSDADYTAQVDAGIYQDFVHDSAGYGLAQWTFWSRKQKLFPKQIIAFCPEFVNIHGAFCGVSAIGRIFVGDKPFFSFIPENDPLLFFIR